MKIFYRATLVFLGLVVVTVIAGHIYISHYAKEIFQEIVSRVSHDTYRLEAQSVDFYFWNAGISGEKIKLVPASGGHRQASLSVDRVEFRLHSLWHLIRNRSLEVKTIEIIRPGLTAWAKKKSGSAQKGIAETIDGIQSKIFEIIDILKVENVLIADAALKIYSAGPDPQSHLALNHLTLKLDHIQVLPPLTAGTPLIKMDGSLTLLNPSVQLPDSNISASLGKLVASISNQSLAIDELNLSVNNVHNRRQKIRLSSIRINEFNWQRYLSEGVIELDTVMATKGMAAINLAPKKAVDQNDMQAQQTGYQGASIIIHHTIVSDVSYNLTKDNLSNGKMKEVSLQLKGDNLYFEDFSLIKGREPAVDVKKLAIALRDVQEGDDKGDMRFSLGELQLDSNALVLKKYLLETNVSDPHKNYLKVAVPEFRLENYALEEIFQKRIAATSIQLIHPDITLDIRQPKKKDSAAKKNLDLVLANLMKSVSSKVALSEIAVENGDFTLLPTLSPDDSINISGLSVIFDAARFPQVKDFHDFIRSIRSLDSKGFMVKGKNMELAIGDMKLLKIPRGLYFGSIKGNFGRGKEIDLKGVTVLINDSISNYRRKNDFHASQVWVDSGSISLELLKKTGPKAPGGGKPSLFIDTLDLNNVVFTMRQGKTTGVSAAIHVDASNIFLRDGNLYWDRLDVMAEKPDVAFEKTSFSAGNLDFIQPGLIRIQNAVGHTSTPYSSIDFKSESLEIKVGLNSTNNPSLRVDDVAMVRPDLNIHLKKKAGSAQGPRKPGKPIGRDVALKRLLMTEPSVNITLTDSAGRQTSLHRVYTGTFVLEDIHTLKRPELNIGRLAYQTSNPRSEINGVKINPSSIKLQLSRVKYNTVTSFFGLHVDTAQVQNINHTLYGKKQDTVLLDAGTIGLGNFDFARGDTLSAQRLLYSAKWWLSNANIRVLTPGKTIEARNIQASGEQTVSLGLDSFAILNRLSKEAFWQTSPYEKGYETITGGKLKVQDIKLALAGGLQQADIGKVITENLHFTTSKDKTKLEDTVAYRALLTQMLKNMPVKAKMDSLLLSNARVDAHEISRKTGKETHIFFTEINGYLKNVKTWDIHDRDTLDMRVRARFFGTDQLRLHFKQSYDDSLQGFWMRVRMSHFNMPEMNKLLTPLMGLKIHSGTIDSLLLVANGNDYFAYGTMDLRYHNLHAKLLKTEETKGKFLISIENFFAGLLLHKHDNGRTNLLFKERLRKRSIFNFWAKIGLEGLLTNLGVKRDKKEKKEFEKTIQKFNLPEKYWDEIDDL